MGVEEKMVNGHRFFQAACSTCGKQIWKRADASQRHKDYYCSQECHNIGNRRGQEMPCGECGKMVYRTPGRFNKVKFKSGKVFCNKSCSAAYNNRTLRSGEDHPNWSDGYSSYRKKAMSKYGARCAVPGCELTVASFSIPARMLDVHHIDGDRSNNDVSNLMVCCVWCHAKITRGIIKLPGVG